MAARSEPELQLLEAISGAVRRQQAALLAGDARAINTQFEALLELMAELAALSDRAGDARAGQEDATTVALAALARHVHEQLAINQVLIRGGMTITDHYMAAAAAAAAAANQALFSGVG